MGRFSDYIALDAVQDITVAMAGSAAYKYEEDFDHGGRTVVDAALASETDPYGFFFDGGTDSTGEWLVSYDTVVAATQLPAPSASVDGAFGIAVCTTDATSGERISYQKVGTSVVPTAAKPLIFRWRGKFTNTTQDAFIGLAVTGATDPHASRPAGFVAFTLTGDAVLQKATADAGAATASAALNTTTSIVANTYVELGLYWDGVDTWHFYVNGVSKGTSALTPPTGLALSPVCCVESNGSAEAMFSDRIVIVAHR